MSPFLTTDRISRHPFGQALCATVLGLLATASVPARAVGTDVLPTVDNMAQLEQRASQANPREQLFLYTELVHTMVQQAGREIADGETEQAALTLKQINIYAGLIHLCLAHDAKRVKAAQELMHNTTYRLTEVLHLVSGEDRVAVQDTLKQLDQINEELLTQVFNH